MKRPNVICLCGSTRFTPEMLVIQWELTKQGNVVLSWCALPDSYFKGEDKTHVGDQEGVKEIVDETHKRKIDLADEVFVLNIEGYIGESTRSEIEYAELHRKPIRYLEQTEDRLVEIESRYDYRNKNGDFFYDAIVCAEKIQLVKDMAWLIGDNGRLQREVNRLENTVRSKNPKKWEFKLWVDKCTEYEKEILRLRKECADRSGS